MAEGNRNVRTPEQVQRFQRQPAASAGRHGTAKIGHQFVAASTVHHGETKTASSLSADA